MDVGRASMPPKLLVADKLMADAHVPPYMAAIGCHLVGCSLCILLVNIEILSLTARDQCYARIVL